MNYVDLDSFLHKDEMGAKEAKKSKNVVEALDKTLIMLESEAVLLLCLK